jgi:hypothetical protein
VVTHVYSDLERSARGLWLAKGVVDEAKVMLADADEGMARAERLFVQLDSLEEARQGEVGIATLLQADGGRVVRGCQLTCHRSPTLGGVGFTRHLVCSGVVKRLVVGRDGGVEGADRCGEVAALPLERAKGGVALGQHEGVDGRALRLQLELTREKYACFIHTTQVPQHVNERRKRVHRVLCDYTRDRRRWPGEDDGERWTRNRGTRVTSSTGQRSGGQPVGRESSQVLGRWCTRKRWVAARGARTVGHSELGVVDLQAVAEHVLGGVELALDLEESGEVGEACGRVHVAFAEERDVEAQRGARLHFRRGHVTHLL